MFHYFNFRRDEYLSHYHKRSNVESTFSMIKAKFRDHVLIQEMYELGIDPLFWQDPRMSRQFDVF